MEAIKTTRKENYILEIIQDESPESPREWDNLGTMICFHRRYNLGDNHKYRHSIELFADLAGIDAEELESDGKALFQKASENYIIMPLFLYDHSGITISTSSFSCPWDSGQIGWIFVSKEKVKQEGLDESKVEDYLKGEVETYDQYLTGDVYGYRISQIDVCDKGCEHKDEIDSCWGFYGEESAQEEGERTLEYYLNKA
jgi:hypothetical protein